MSCGKGYVHLRSFQVHCSVRCCACKRSRSSGWTGWTHYAAGWLHDIGKILISSDIIRKSTTLTPEEYELIKGHVNYGLNIINNLSLPVEIINCIAYHHENWDGTGYPHGLAGESIPFEARILQLADSYSAMIIRRVYRKTLSPEDALNEIISGCGKQFDPNLVKYL